MTVIDIDQSLGDLVTDRPALAREFERLGLDYCCGGQRSLAEACEDAGIDVEAVARALGTDDGPEPAVWATMGPADLVDHLVATHHAYLWAELPRLGALADKVTGVHGARHPELGVITATLGELRADLEPHLQKEERILFPMIRQLADADRPPGFHCGTLRNPISVMLAEHDRAGELLSRLRELTGGYTPPPDGCASFEAFYRGLAELEADTHLHVHKENNVLFPAVVTLEETLASR